MHASGQETQDSIEDLLKLTLSYDFEINIMQSLGPDYLIMRDLYDVCAISFSKAEESADRF